MKSLLKPRNQPAHLILITIFILLRKPLPLSSVLVYERSTLVAVLVSAPEKSFCNLATGPGVGNFII